MTLTGDWKIVKVQKVSLPNREHAPVFSTLSFAAYLTLVCIGLGFAEYFLQKAWIRVVSVGIAAIVVIIIGVTERSELVTQAVNAQRDVDAVTTRLTNVQGSLDDAEAVSAEQAEAIEALQIQNTGLSNDLTEAKTSRQTLLVELSAARRIVEQLEARVSDVSIQNADLANELLKARRELADGFERNAAQNRTITSQQERTRREAAESAAAQALASERNSYCAANRGVVFSPQLNQWGGRCCNGQWIRDSSSICYSSNLLP